MWGIAINALFSLHIPPLEMQRLFLLPIPLVSKQVKRDTKYYLKAKYLLKNLLTGTSWDFEIKVFLHNFI